MHRFTGRVEVSTDLKQPDQGRARPTPRARLGTWLAALAAAALLGGVALAVASGGRDARGWASVVVAVAAAAAVSAAAGARGAASRLVPKVQPAGGDLRPRVRELTSEIETVRAELDDRSRRGEEADRLKSLFIANMSHEIRTPLNSVLALTQLLREGVAGPLVPDQRRYLEVIERNGQNLLRLINDILDLSRIEAGRVEVDIQDLSLGPVVAEVVDSLEPLAHKKDLELAVRLPDPPPRVHVDVDRLRQILNNLVGNAIKFTEAGMVQVAAEAGDGEVAIQVVDTGIGIAEADIGKIFREFFQVDQTLARRQGGTGLGLPIAIRLARLMGGDITLQSVVGLGSTFTVRLPLERAAAEAGPAAQAPRASLTPLAGLRLLAAEDNEMNQLVLRTLLEPFGVVPHLVRNGEEAVAAWETGDWRVILMDMQMPVMDGVTATRLIRERETERGLPPTPIIALTANAMSHHAEEYLACGMDEVVAKPLNIAELIHTIERVRQKAEDAALLAPAPRRQPPETAPRARL